MLTVTLCTVSLKTHRSSKLYFSGDLFADEDIITVSAAGGSSGGLGSGGQFHLAPGKIDERVHNILEQENLDRGDMEKCWKKDVSEAQEEVERRTESVSEKICK